MIYFIYLVMFYFSIIVFLRISYPELRWNWNLEKDKKLNFPKNFFGELQQLLIKLKAI